MGSITLLKVINGEAVCLYKSFICAVDRGDSQMVDGLVGNDSSLIPRYFGWFIAILGDIVQCSRCYLPIRYLGR